MYARHYSPAWVFAFPGFIPPHLSPRRRWARNHFPARLACFLLSAPSAQSTIHLGRVDLSAILISTNIFRPQGLQAFLPPHLPGGGATFPSLAKWPSYSAQPLGPSLEPPACKATCTPALPFSRRFDASGDPRRHAFSSDHSVFRDSVAGFHTSIETKSRPHSISFITAPLVHPSTRHWSVDATLSASPSNPVGFVITHKPEPPR